MFIHSTCFFNKLTTSLIFTQLHIIYYPLNPYLAATDNVSTQKYYVKILIIRNNLPIWSATNTHAPSILLSYNLITSKLLYFNIMYNNIF